MRRLAAILAADVETTRDPHIAFDGERIFTSDGSDDGQGPRQPVEIKDVGVIGCEYASIFAALGVRVTLIGKRHRLLPRVRQRARSAGGEFF